MKQHDDARHPGPMRVMRVDAEFAGIIVAVGFLEKNSGAATACHQKTPHAGGVN